MATTEHRHPIAARVLVRMLGEAERRGGEEHRRELLAPLTGKVVEVGAGNGLNFRHYPPGVTQVLAVEPEPYLRSLAEEAAADAPVPVRVVSGVAEALPFPDASFDGAVSSLVLCGVDDQSVALAELRRVLRPGSPLRFYEHVRANRRGLRTAQQVADLVWPHVSGGCHLTRTTVGAIAAAGFELRDVRRFGFAPSLLARFAAPHVIGTAVRSR